MKKRFPILTLLSVPAVFIGSALASPDFTEADQDNDGYLSIQEAKSAMPALLIVDMNNDGLLNKSEARLSLESLELPPTANCHDDMVRDYEFQLIVKALENEKEKLREIVQGG